MKTVIGLAILLPVLVLTGCGDAEDDKRLNVDLISMNLNAPVYADVHHANGTPEDPTDDYIPTDQIEVTFVARPYDDVLAIVPGKAFGSVRFTEYSIVYGDPANGGEDFNNDEKIDLPNFTAPMNLVVPAYNSATAFVLVVPIGVKGSFPVSGLRQGGVYNTTAVMTFKGVEETSRFPVEVTQGIAISIANFGDE